MMTVRRILLVAFLLFGGALNSLAQKPLPVVATLPYLGEICRAIGGHLVDVTVLARPGEDPHDIKVTPSMTAKVAKARLFIENGMTLETWSFRLIEASGNRFVKPGQSGHIFATKGITPLEQPSQALLNSGAHVHAAGNPHVWLDPINLKIIARNIEKGFARSLYKSTTKLAARRAAFEKRIDTAMFGAELLRLVGGKTLESRHRTGTLIKFLEMKSYRGKRLIDLSGGWLKRALMLKSKNVISYHRTWSYFERAFHLKVVATLESKPGIPPSPTHLDKLKVLAAQKNARLVLAPIYYPKSRIEGFAKKISSPLVILATQPGEAGAPAQLIKMFDHIFTKLEEAQR